MASAIEQISYTGAANKFVLEPHGWRPKPRDNITPHRNRLMDAPLGRILIDDYPPGPLDLEICVPDRDKLELLFLQAGTKTVVWQKTLSNPDGAKRNLEKRFFRAGEAYVSLSRLSQRRMPIRLQRKIHDAKQEAYIIGADVFARLVAKDDSGRELTFPKDPSARLTQSLFALSAFSLR
jgi:hypothetical protein